MVALSFVERFVVCRVPEVSQQRHFFTENIHDFGVLATCEEFRNDSSQFPSFFQDAFCDLSHRAKFAASKCHMDLLTGQVTTQLCKNKIAMQPLIKTLGCCTSLAFCFLVEYVVFWFLCSTVYSNTQCLVFHVQYYWF